MVSTRSFDDRQGAPVFQLARGLGLEGKLNVCTERKGLTKRGLRNLAFFLIQDLGGSGRIFSFSLVL